MDSEWQLPLWCNNNRRFNHITQARAVPGLETGRVVPHSLVVYALRDLY